MLHFVYIAECSDGTLYAGYTVDLARRMDEHNTSKKGARYTKNRRPVVLKYSESFKEKGEALKREYEIKSMPREKKFELIDGYTAKNSENI